MTFQESVRLNYQIKSDEKEIIYIRIWGNSSLTGDVGEIIIDDNRDVEYILNYINSLELVQREMPKQRNFQNNGHFYIDIFEKDSFAEKAEILDTLLFSTQYLSVVHKGYDWDYTDYYIKNVGYNPITKTSNVYQFLYDLIE